MDDLESTGLLHSAVRGGAVWTVNRFPGEGEDCLTEILPLKVLEVGSAEALEVCATVLFLEHHSGAGLNEVVSDRTQFDERYTDAPCICTAGW